MKFSVGALPLLIAGASAFSPASGPTSRYAYRRKETTHHRGVCADVCPSFCTNTSVSRTKTTENKELSPTHLSFQPFFYPSPPTSLVCLLSLFVSFDHGDDLMIHDCLLRRFAAVSAMIEWNGTMQYLHNNHSYDVLNITVERR